MKTFGKRLKELRKTRNLSQEEVAFVLGVAPGTISRYESLKMMPTEEVIYKTCRFFKISADYVLGLSEIKKVNKDIMKNYEEKSRKAEKYDIIKDTLYELEFGRQEVQ